MVGGYRQWQRVGRRVCGGQRAAGYIWAPRGKSKKQQTSDEQQVDALQMAGDDNQGESSSRYVRVPVFDVSQTEPIEEATA